MRYEHKTYSLNLRGRLFQADKPLVMGILNITPDSFHSPSRTNNLEDIVFKAGQLITQGADIIDIGGQSTRPGAERISQEVEMERVIPAIRAVHKNFPGAVISVDTFYAAVAEQAVINGALIINDISGGSIDSKMFETAGKLHVPYVLTHIQGEPQSMQTDPSYQDVTGEVLNYFTEKIATLRKAGVHDIILDPGFGFGKTMQHNLELLRNLETFKILGLPILVGMSRKKTIQNILGVDAENALYGTIAMNTIALMSKADIIRVHDVKPAADCVKIVQAVRAEKKHSQIK